MSQINAYLITCLTNMHVGAGGTNYDIIDNMVQRDVTTHLPTIHSSSLKGALREFFKNEWGDNDNKLNFIFGPDTSRNNKEEGGVGNFKFLPADLISLPVRAKNKMFYNATSQFAINHINDLGNALGLGDIIQKAEVEKNQNPLINGKEDILEDWSAYDGLHLEDKNIGNDIALFSEEHFKRLAEKLPIIARNKLINGESKYLFYEEVVPRETRFIFFVIKNGEESYSQAFDEQITKKVVQIGANGSIGYGFCKISKIK